MVACRPVLDGNGEVAPRQTGHMAAEGGGGWGFELLLDIDKRNVPVGGHSMSGLRHDEQFDVGVGSVLTPKSSRQMPAPPTHPTIR